MLSYICHQDKFKVSQQSNLTFELDENFITKSGEHCAERKLWQAVIFQAFMDGCTQAIRTSEKIAKEDARDWLSNETKNLATVCLWANMDLEAVMRSAKHLFAQDLPKFKCKMLKNLVLPEA